MKRSEFIASFCLVIGFLLVQGATAETSCASKSCKMRDSRPLKVLMIGNSFTESVMREAPMLAKSSGLKLDIVQCGIGGCPFDRHWGNVEKSGDKNFKPYGVRSSLSSGDAKKVS